MEASMNNDINIEPEKENLKVTIDSELIETLTPNAYLASLGITLEQRKDNLIQLAFASLSPRDICSDLKTQVPFMVTKGPFIKEEFLTVNVSCIDDDGKYVIALGLTKEPEEPELPGIFNDD
jgi:hypothetical protein